MRIPGMQGQQFVLRLYALLVALSGAVAATVPLLIPDVGAPRLFFLVPFPASVGGYAAYGAVTTALLLGVGIVVLEATSRRAE